MSERAGMPSASSMARTLNCPAWIGRAATSAAIELPEKKWTSAGTLAHAVLSGDVEDEEVEDDDDLTTAIRICREKEAMALVSIGFEEPEIHIEERIFLHDDAGEPVASGKPDRLYINGRQGCITDFKTGRKDALPSARNPAMIMYAILGQEQFGVDEWYLGIIPAWRQTPPMALIGKDQLSEWRRSILDAIKESEGLSPRACAGPWCEYCPVRHECPEAWAEVEQVSKFNPEEIMHCEPELVIERYDLAKRAEATIKTLLENVKARLALDPACLPGLAIGKASEIKTIPGSEQNYLLLIDRYPVDAVLAAAKWTPAALAKSITGGKGAKAVQKTIEEQCADIIRLAPKSGALERV